MPRGLAGAAAGKVRLRSGLVFCPTAEGEGTVWHTFSGKMVLARCLLKVTQVWSLRHRKCLFRGSGVASGSVEGFLFSPKDKAALFL